MTDDQLKKSVDNYQPNSEVKTNLQQISFLAVVGASTSGKTTLVKMLCDNSDLVEIVMSETSRLRREGERDGEEYFFRRKQDMIDDLKNGWLVQVALSPNGELYATRAEDYPKTGVGVMPVFSHVIKTFRGLPFNFFYTAFIVPSSFEAWMSWFNGRPANPDEKSRRLAEASQSYKFALEDNQTKYVLNDELQKAYGRLLQVAKGQNSDDEELAIATAKTNYAKLLKLLNKSSN
ncbi:MAG: hypothetical protein Q7R60_01570 [bacterium]|nr:hypothetical protein [bacterium]